MKIGKRTKDCMRFERTVTIQEFYSFPFFCKIECSWIFISLSLNSFYTHEEYSQQCLETLFSLCTYRNIFINFILHSCEQFFIYTFFFLLLLLFLPLSLRSVEIAYKNSERSFRTRSTRFYRWHSIHLYLPTFFEFAPHHVSHISFQCLSQI